MGSITLPAPVMSWLQPGGGGRFVCEDAPLLSCCDEPGRGGRGGGGGGGQEAWSQASPPPHTHTIMHDR